MTGQPPRRKLPVVPAMWGARYCRGRRGFTLIELLVGLLLGLGTIAALTAAVTVSLAARARAAAGAEMLAATAAAIDQIARDVRLAGYDPRRSGIQGIVTAESANLVLEADLDGDGAIDLSSEEHVAYRRSATGALQRVVGEQSSTIAFRSRARRPGVPLFRRRRQRDRSGGRRCGGGHPDRRRRARNASERGTPRECV